MPTSQCDPTPTVAPSSAQNMTIKVLFSWR